MQGKCRIDSVYSSIVFMIFFCKYLTVVEPLYLQIFMYI